jgi:hypothetical protein
MDNPILAVAFSVVLIFLATGFLLRDRARRAKRTGQVVKAGFEPCADQTEKLVEIVTMLENNPAFRFSVDSPMRAIANENPCYFYTKLRLQRTRVAEAEELLASLTRPSESGLLLLFETPDFPIRSAHQWGEVLYPGIRNWQPQDLRSIDLPPASDRGQIVAAFGPPAATLYELVSRRTLATLEEVGSCNVSTVTFRRNWCSFTAPGPRTKLDVAKLRSLACRL